MKISATVRNASGKQLVQVRTDEKAQELAVAAKPAGGSVVNGGEFLMLALATCYCNDLYREAARLGLQLESVDVTACATFEGVGLAARNVRYWASVKSDAAEADIERLLRETDAVAEVHNTIRQGAAVTLEFAKDDDASR